MFNNLLAEMARNKITNEAIAFFLQITPNTISNKLSGKTEFTRKEMWLIRKEYFPNCTIDYLFGS